MYYDSSLIGRGIMEKIGVVVLNYKNYNETINCVNSLLGQSNVDLEIVIVENGSNNDSEKVLNLYPL